MGNAEEEENADLPTQTLMKWLRAAREYVRLAPDKRRAFKTDFPFLDYHARKGETMDDEASGPVSDAIGTLTDDDIRTLARTGRVAVSNFTLSPLQTEQIIHAAQPAGFYNPQSKESLAGPCLRFEKGQEPGHYFLFLAFTSGPVDRLPAAFNFDTLDNGGEFDWTREMLARMQREERAAPVELIDAKKRVTGKFPVMSLAAALDLWSRATGRAVLGEIFLRDKAALPITSDKPETLLTRICLLFGWDWRKVGSDYLVYSKSWAADRAADIPDALLDRWQAAIDKAMQTPLDTLLEMSQLRDAQIGTLQEYVYITALRRKQNLPALRVLNTLNKAERERALTAKEGLELNVFAPKVHAALTTLFPTVTKFRGAVLTFECDTTRKFPAYTITITLSSGETEYGFFTLSPPAPPMRIYQ